MWFDALWDWLVWFWLHRVTRLVAAWLIALTSGALVLEYAWRVFHAEYRPNGNSGHTTIDFGGQWLMGAMLVQGKGQELYNRDEQRKLLQVAYPKELEPPDDKKTEEEKLGDAENLMRWFMTKDRSADPAQRPVGGPLYPPVHAIFFAPIGLFDPLTGYHINQALSIVWAFLGGLGVSYLTRRRIWWPVATTLILIYPGFKAGIQLGQNPPLTLCILIWGWALLARGRPVAGGMVWGLLAFKPVWALAFLLVPLVARQWRFCLAMIGTGVALGLATLPFVGLHSWFDWLEVGKVASRTYNTDQNWVFYSRDLLGLPRRWLLDFQISANERDRFDAALIGWAMLVACLEITLLLAALRKDQAKEPTGPPAAFLLMGAWLCCYHFMYYDVLLTALPFFVLCAEPRRLLEPTFLAFTTIRGPELPGDFAAYYRPLPGDDYPPPAPSLELGYRNFWVFNKIELNLFALLLLWEHAAANIYWGLTMTNGWMDRPLELGVRVGGYYFPWDTLLLIVFWLWCGVRWLWQEQTPDTVCG